MKDKVKIVFLDIDGVIATQDSLYEELSKYYGITVKELYNKHLGPDKLCEMTDLPYPNISMYDWPFDQNVIYRLYELQLKTNCKFVMCSTWRIGRSIDEINEIMTLKGCRINFIDKTKTLNYERNTRGLEIKQWLEENKNKYDVESYAIIDDDCSYDIVEIHPDNCITPKFKTGFTDELLKDTIKILNNEI